MSKVYVAIDVVDKNATIKSKERQNYINTINNLDVKLRSASVWALLEKIKDKYFYSLSNDYYMNEKGKWKNDDFYFSLTHDEDIVCVSLSEDIETGIDVAENSRFNEKITKYILERDNTVNDPAVIWTLNEAYFKLNNDYMIFSKGADSMEYKRTYTIVYKNNQFTFSIISKKNTDVIFLINGSEISISSEINFYT